MKQGDYLPMMKATIQSIDCHDVVILKYDEDPNENNDRITIIESIPMDKLEKLIGWKKFEAEHDPYSVRIEFKPEIPIQDLINAL